MGRALNVIALAVASGFGVMCTASHSGDPTATLQKFGAEMQKMDRDAGASASSCFLADSPCSFADLPRGQPTLVHPGGATRCISSDRPEYRFQVVPGDSDKLVLFFQGGGLCWNDFTAGLACFRDAMPDKQGIFNRGDSTNPFRNYTIVDVLYCSGDLHVGMVNNSWGPQAGWANTQSVLDWTLASFPSLSSLVISGSSAGSLAAQLLAKYVLRRFEGRYTRAAVIADSFAGVTPPTIQPTLTRQFNFCETPPVKEEGFSERCRAGELRIQDVYLDAMRSFPNVSFANIQSKTDIVQILFWDLWVDVERTAERNIEGVRLLRLVNDMFELYNQQPNFVSYMVNGAHHVFLELDTLFTADPSGPNRGLIFRPKLKEWLSDMVAERPSASSVCLGLRYPRSSWGRDLVGVLYCDSAQCDKGLNLTRGGGH